MNDVSLDVWSDSEVHENLEEKEETLKANEIENDEDFGAFHQFESETTNPHDIDLLPLKENDNNRNYVATKDEIQREENLTVSDAAHNSTENDDISFVATMVPIFLKVFRTSSDNEQKDLNAIRPNHILGPTSTNGSSSPIPSYTIDQVLLMEMDSHRKDCSNVVEKDNLHDLHQKALSSAHHHARLLFDHTSQQDYPSTVIMDERKTRFDRPLWICWDIPPKVVR